MITDPEVSKEPGLSHDELWDIDDIDMSFTDKTDKPFVHMKINNG